VKTIRMWLRDRRALTVVLAVAMAGWGVVHFDLFESLHAFSHDHEGWELDEAFSFMILVSLLLPVVLWRWNRALTQAHRRASDAQAETQRIALHDPLADRTAQPAPVPAARRGLGGPRPGGGGAVAHRLPAGS
jgi:hypothetical protein